MNWAVSWKEKASVSTCSGITQTRCPVSWDPFFLPLLACTCLNALSLFCAAQKLGPTFRIPRNGIGNFIELTKICVRAFPFQSPTPTSPSLQPTPSSDVTLPALYTASTPPSHPRNSTTGGCTAQCAQLQHEPFFTPSQLKCSSSTITYSSLLPP